MGDRNEEEQQEEIETESQETENNPVGFAEFTSKDCWMNTKLIKFRNWHFRKLWKLETRPVYHKMILTDISLS